MRPPDPCDDEALYQRYLAALLANDYQACRSAFISWMESRSDLRSLYDDLVKRALYEVGDLWESGRISVATEHMATAVSESLLNLTYPRLFAGPRNGRSAIVSCVANEYHQIGGKMVSDLFELNGWRGYFLGANTPLADVKALIADKEPDVVALSASVVFSMDTLVGAVSDLRAAFPAVPILVGGQAFRWGGREHIEQVPGVRCLASLGELETWMDAASR